MRRSIKEFLFERPKSFAGMVAAGVFIGVIAVASKLVAEWGVAYLNNPSDSSRVADSHAPVKKPSADAQTSSGEIVGSCPLIPFSEREKLSPKCQLINYKNDIEKTRFNECFRILNISGVQQARCDTPDRRYLFDAGGNQPRIVVMSAQGEMLGQINISVAGQR